MNCGTLYIVATPIGNLNDITLRAIETLKNVDTIACEDTRVSRKLLQHFEIRKPLISLHQHSGEKAIEGITDRLKRGENIAYITDSGTPSISDPGGELVKVVQDIRNMIQGYKQSSKLKTQISNEIHPSRPKREPRSENPNLRMPYEVPATESGSRSECIGTSQTSEDNKLKIIPIPGPSALTAAISVSGMVEKEFYFAGFLPKKKGRQTKLNQLKNIKIPIVIYESAFRIERTLKDIEKYFGQDCEIFIAREITKMFEEFWGGKILDVLGNIQSHKLKGEIVLIVKQS